jgi:predicted dienelactone hydrolase
MLARYCSILLNLLLLAGAFAPHALADSPVGRSDITFVDDNRGGRSIPCDLYYPGESDGWDVPVADPPAMGFAPAAFGHGYQISSTAYAWVAERLAAIGCVVAVPRTETGLFPDHGEFGRDLAFVLRALRGSGTDPGSPFFGRIGSHALVMGHSMGGGCSFLAAAGDSSITAVANFAAAETNPSAISACGSIARSALVFAGTNDCVTPPASNQQPMYDALSGWRTLVTIEGASHCQFNAYSFLCEFGEFCSADITRQVQQDRVWLLLEPWVKAVMFHDSVAVQEFQTLLATGTEWTYLQDGSSTAVHNAPVLSIGRIEAYPNPFTATLTIGVSIDVAGPARLAIFDVAGRLVRTLLDTRRASDWYSLSWDGYDTNGRRMPSGVYMARLSTSSGDVTAKLVLVR